MPHLPPHINILHTALHTQSRSYYATPHPSPHIDA
jgi:hypothetical protein